MPYQINPSNNFPILPLTKELVAIREDIFNNVQHKQKNFELCREAYDQLKAAHGQPPSSKRRLCRSGCIHQMNKLLGNYLRQWENNGGRFPEDLKVESKTLKPKDMTLKPLVESAKQKELEDLSWAVLNEMAIKKNNGKRLDTTGRASKKILIEFLLND